MAPHGAYPIRLLALFNLTSEAIPETWLQHIQREADKDNDDSTIIMPVSAGPHFTRLDMARHSHQHFRAADSPFASRCFLAADEYSIETKTVIIINLVRKYLEKNLNDNDEEDEIVEGHMRSHPNSCITFARIFDQDIQGIDKYYEIAHGASDHILPRINTPVMEDVPGSVTICFPGQDDA